MMRPMLGAMYVHYAKVHNGLDEDDWESLSSGLEEYDDEDEESGEDGAEFLPFDGMGGGIYFD